ncbi:formyltetrahydrofolate deformylase [Lentisalinibacter salinarum]|uniref:formyltetrahydrofolate deformylase n=1 Tax=Lentisalinibacter salinarum TaxID=2992239 RepID=UPI003868515C
MSGAENAGQPSREYILTMHCPDRPGILAAVTGALAEQGGDVRDAQSFADDSTDEFFVRMHALLPSDEAAAAFGAAIGELAVRLGIGWELHDCAVAPRVMIMVSKFDHCLRDLLHRRETGALRADIPLVVSNHDDARELVEWHGIPFVHLPVSKDSRPEQEAEVLRLVREHRIELVVLARYMQILSAGMVRELAGRCINIHHSFLPSFKGAMPYRQAHERGVKLIGATAHYVTEDLDEGPIIEQDVRRVTHATTESEMTGIGRETEASVLARAVRWHVERRILLNGVKTVVFP